MKKDRLLNDSIKVSKVFLIDDSGNNFGDMSLSQAKEKAKEKNLDLMQMGKKGDLTIVKMLDYGKFLYKQKKQEQKNKQAAKTADLKTLRITFKISDHDLDVKKKQAEKFSKGGHPLKISLRLRGRENHYSSIAKEKMESFVELLSEIYKLERKINVSGNNYSATLLPIK